MKKVPNLFERDWNGDKSRVLPIFNKREFAAVSWVLDGHGIPTVKWDGSAVMVSGPELLCRFDAKNGKAPPAGFIPAQDPDPTTGHWPGWVPAMELPQYKWHRHAFFNSVKEAHDEGFGGLPDGTYEAVGPHLQSNPYKFGDDLLIKHGVHRLLNRVPNIYGSNGPAAHELLTGWLESFRFSIDGMPEPMPIEGIVWHHEEDGRMVKVLASDLGLPWKNKVR